MSDSLTSLAGTEEAVWTTLADGVLSADSPARTVALATEAALRGGAVRMVVLRAVDRDARTLTIFTHRASSKVSEIAAVPRVEVLVWDPAQQFQIRLNALATISDGPQEMWQNFGPGTRRNYADPPRPGRTLTVPDEVTPDPDPAAFVVLTLTIETVETLWLAPDVQRRARFTKGGADWIAP